MNSTDSDAGQDALADDWAAALEEKGVNDPMDDEVGKSLPSPIENAPTKGENPNLDVILDIPVNISMEVGSTEISIRNLLKLNQGSVIELDRLAGEPLDVLVNGTLVAHGEVVVVNDKFGIRLTDIISASERIKNLA